MVSLCYPRSVTYQTTHT